jgi:hypothetical protein
MLCNKTIVLHPKSKIIGINKPKAAGTFLSQISQIAN